MRVKSDNDQITTPEEGAQTQNPSTPPAVTDENAPTNPEGFHPVPPAADPSDDPDAETTPRTPGQVLEDLDIEDLASQVSDPGSEDAIQTIMDAHHAQDAEKVEQLQPATATDLGASLGVPVAQMSSASIERLTQKPEITNACFVPVQHYSREIQDGKEVLVASPIIEGYKRRNDAGVYEAHLAELIGYKCATIKAPTQDEDRPIGELHQQSQAQAWGWPLVTEITEIPDGKGGVVPEIKPKLDAQGNVIRQSESPVPLYLVNCRRQRNDGLTTTKFQSKDGGVFLYATRQNVMRDGKAVVDGTGNPVTREVYGSFNIMESNHPGLEQFRANLRVFRESEPMEGEDPGVTETRAFAKNMPDDTEGNAGDNQRAIGDGARTIKINAAGDVNSDQAAAIFGR